MITETFTLTWTKRGTKPFECRLAMKMSNGRHRYRASSKISAGSVISLGMIAGILARDATWSKIKQSLAQEPATPEGKA